VIAILRPHAWDFPLFLHVFGAMVLFGSVLATTTLSLAGWRLPTVRGLSRSTFWALVAAAIPAWIVMRVGAQWAYSKEHHQLFEKDPGWIGIGFIVADLGLLILLLATGFAFWWQRSQKPVAGRIVSGLAVLYLVLLAVAWLAMSGKWGGVSG
jgi:phosphatidylglycerophosphatase A